MKEQTEKVEPKVEIRKGEKIRRCHERELKWFAARGWQQTPAPKGAAQ
jgi:hypothetical protein